MTTLTMEGQQEVTSNGPSTTFPPEAKLTSGKCRTLIEKYTSCRWRLSYMVALVLAQVQIIRAAFSFAIVCMTGEATQIRGDNFNRSSSTDEYANFSVNTSGLDVGPTGEFDYSSATQGMIISSVNYGSIISPVIGSLTSRRFGPKKVIGLFMTVCGAMMLLTPIAARTHLVLLVVCRVITGITTGPTGEFDYSSATQGMIISSVNYGSIISPVIGSLTSRRFGPKKVIGLFMTVCGAMMLLTPIAARTHLVLLVVCRVITGITTTVTEPALIAFWLNWAPIGEKAQLIAYSYIGYTLGSVMLFALSGNMCLIPIDKGWPFIFYIFGTCTLLWCVAWYLTVFDTPESHPRISEKEKSYIVSTRSKEASGGETKNIPWKSIVTTKGVWAFVIVGSSHVWTTMVLLSYLPLYMATVLNFDVEQNALLSALPFASRGLGAIIWGHVGAKLEKLLSVTNTRKLIQCTGYMVSAGFSIALCYVGKGQVYIAVTIFIISTPFQAVIFNAGMVTAVDMAPQYASVISSLGLCFNVIMMISSPQVVSYIIRDRSREQWVIVFYINAAIYLFASITFVLFGSGQLQPWADNSRGKNNAEDHVHKNGQVNETFVADMDEVTHM